MRSLRRRALLRARPHRGVRRGCAQIAPPRPPEAWDQRRSRSPHRRARHVPALHTQGSARVGCDARSPWPSSPAALLSGGAPAHPPDGAHRPRTRARSRSARASARSPHPPRRPAADRARGPRARADRPDGDPSDPCPVVAAATPADRSSAAARSCASSWPAGALASPPAPRAGGCGDPSARAPRRRPRVRRHRWPPPQSGPHLKIRRAGVMSPAH